MRKNVAVIGLGHLGRRYLEGLLQTGLELKIWAVDNSDDALADAQKVVSQSKSQVPVEFLTSAREMPSIVDLAIGATTADVRIRTLTHLLEESSVRYVILEKIIAQSLAESEELKRLIAPVEQVWVNYPMRLMEWHRALREYVYPNAPVRASVVGVSWGLITSGLHFIDLFEWWTGSASQEIHVHENSLEWFESKRPGFLEATGRIDVTFSDGGVLSLQSNPKCSQPGERLIHVRGGGKSLHISESDGVARGSMLDRPMTGRLELQSQLTGPLVDQILKTGACRLPSLHDVLTTHDLFLSSLLAAQDPRYVVKGRLMVT